MRDKVIVKHEEGADRFTFSFIYSFAQNSPGRQFNMSRELTEESSTFIQRIQANVGKVVNKKKKKGGEEVTVEVQFFKLDEDINLEMKKTAKDLIYEPNIKMKIDSKEFDVILNPPLVEDVRIAEPLMTHTYIYPFKLKTVFAEESRTKFKWFVSKDPSETSPGGSTTKKVRLDSLNSGEWKERGEHFFFIPNESDIGSRVRLDVTPVLGEVEGDTRSIISSGLVEAGPDTTPTLNRQAWTKQKTEHPVVRVVSYNLLADLYADSDFSRTTLFPQCPPFALEFRYRVKLILNELINFNPDIICLQENDSKVFRHDLVPVLGKLGFKGEFTKKGGQVEEGLALFYREGRFKLLESRRTVFAEELEAPRFAHIYEKIRKNDSLVQRLRERTTAVFVSVLQSLQDPRKLVIVGNTHLFFKPDADHIRLLQFEKCLTEIQILRAEMIEKNPFSEIGVILCGDFNSTPPFGVLQYCLEGRIGAEHNDWSSTPAEKVENLNLAHSLNLGSATGTPKYTNYTIEFKDCLDYIFYDKSRFEVEQVVPFPTDEELEMYIALPNISFPSDHISSVADLRWK